MSHLLILENDETISFGLDDLRKYHGSNSICGLTVSFKIMEAAFAALADGAPVERGGMSLATGFPGPGARDGFELVMRVVTRDRYRIETDVTPSDKIAEAAKGVYYFRISAQGREVELGLKPEIVPAEFVPLRRRVLAGQAEAEELAAFRRLQFDFSETLLSTAPSDAVNILSLDQPAGEAVAV